MNQIDSLKAAVLRLYLRWRDEEMLAAVVEGQETWLKREEKRLAPLRKRLKRLEGFLKGDA